MAVNKNVLIIPAVKRAGNSESKDEIPKLRLRPTVEFLQTLKNRPAV